MYLPTGGANGESNAFNFGYGVLPFLRQDYSYTRAIEGKDLVRSINQLILDDFSALYGLYKHKQGLTNLAINRVQLNTRAGEDIMSVVKNRIIDHFLEKKGNLANNLEDAYSVIMHTRRSLYKLTETRANDPLSGRREDSIRTQFLNFFKNQKSSGTITFWGLVIDNAVLSLNFQLSEFDSKFTHLDGNNKPTWWSAFDANYIESHNSKIINDRVNILLDLIGNLPSRYNKKVRLFITQNIGVSKTSGIDFGYQYISSKPGASEWIPRPNSPFGPYIPAYIDIDLGGGNQAWELSKLRYAVLLSLSAEKNAQRLGFYNPRDFSLIIKEEGSVFTDAGYLAIFNGQYLTQFSPMHSVAGVPSTTRISYSQVVLTGPYGDFLLSNDLSNRWTISSNFIPLWVSGTTPKIKDFGYYTDFINHP